MSKQFYDRLSDTYDQEVMDSDNRNEFPYSGYQKVLHFIASSIEEDPHLGKCRVLDLGIGSGTLEAEIKPEKFDLTGIDYSEKMLEIARLKMPNGVYICHDFRKGLPEEIRNDKFDVIIASYAFHEFNETDWIEYVHSLSYHLTVFGKIFIGDFFFLNEKEKRECKAMHRDGWDDLIHYHVYEWIQSHMCTHLATSFVKLSYCAGVIIVEKYHECTLQNDHVLVKY